jgi:hypothetical protein
VKHRRIRLKAPSRRRGVWELRAGMTAMIAALSAAGCSASNTSSAPLFGSTGGASNGGGVPNGGAGVVAGNGAFGGASPSPSGAAPGQVVSLDASFIVNPPVDPSIQFNWPVDNPNPSTLSCQPGHYTGAFAGLYTSPITVVGVPIPVVGDVNLTLTQSPTGEFFTITNGTVNGRADILAQYRCAFNGTLNCTTKKLEMGSIDCGYCVGAYVPDGGICLGLESHFKGPLKGDYNGASQSFENATWSGKEGADSGIFGGAGIWTATYTP